MSTSIKGAVFSINVPHNQNDSRTVTPSPHTIFTVVAGGSVDYSNDASASNIMTPSPHTIFTVVAGGSVDYSNDASASNIMTPSPHTIFTVDASSIHNYYFNNSHELSLFADDAGIVIRNKMPLYDITAAHGVLKNSDNSYVVNFSLGTTNYKIELYINSINVLNAGNTSPADVLTDNKIQLFSISGESDYLTSGLKNVIVYNKRLEQEDIALFKKLKGN
jgi:hypothetical protein